jgi:hypothetical protein
MRHAFCFAILLSLAACRSTPPADSVLVVWAGDSAQKSSDFLAVIDANAGSPTYGTVVTSLATGVSASHPHHTEAEMPADGHLLANGFESGQTWLFDLTTPRTPKIVTTFGNVAGLSHPHTYVRMANGHVLATFQYLADSATSSPPAPSATPSATPSGAMGGMAGMSGMASMTLGGVHATGGLVEMDERGTLIRRGSARDTTIADTRIYPYSALPLPSIDRIISTTTDMDAADSASTAEWVQLWRLSDLTLLKSVALRPGPRGDEHRFTGEPHLLPDGRSIYIHTFSCGLYLLRGVETGTPTSTFVKGFAGKECGVPILTSHFWLQPVPETHSLVALDISDPEHPREVSSVAFGTDEAPHWIALDPTGTRVVLNSGGGAKSNRLYVVNFNPNSGQLAIDEKFRDAGSARAGVNMNGKTWPHGFTGNALPHGTVFTR